MEKDWVKVFNTAVQYEAEIIKGLLFENNIECVIMNKKDSSYGSFGYLEIYTHQTNALRASHIIQKNKL